MAIDVFSPAIQGVIVQPGFLERAFRNFITPLLRYDRLTTVEPVEARVGESKTLTRPAILPPITDDANPVAAGTDLNQGMTPQSATYEQFNVTLGKLKGMMTLSLEMDETKIASEYLLNWKRLAVQAGQSLDTRAATRVFQAYDGGNTFVTAATDAVTTAHIDNINGFSTQYAFVNGMANGVPSSVSASNKLPALIYSAASPTSPPTAVNIVNIAPDETNTSTAFVGGVAYGVSGTLTFDAAQTLGAGDTIVALDGSVVIRPNGKLSRKALASGDTVVLQNFAKAKARLKNRQAPTLPNGLYPCFIDSEMLADLQLDEAFQRATAQQFGKTPYFQDGIIAQTFGIEFVETTTNPVYSIGNGLVARHAMVMAADAVVKAPFAGSLNAARKASTMGGVADIKITDDGIVLITRAPIDVEADTVTQTWRFTGGHVCQTDVTSTPAQIPTTDNARYKRGILVEAASAA